MTKGYVAAVDIGGTNLRVALADLSGKVIARWSASTEGIRDAAVVVEMMRAGVEEMLDEHSLAKSDLRAVAAGAPGVTNVEAGVVIATSYLMGWRDVPLRAMLEEAFGVPATVDNDVNAAAVGEGWAGEARGVRDFVFVAIGTGVGAGIVLNGKLFQGIGWTAGEIGYMLVPGTSEEPVERGKPGALEGVVGGEGIRDFWHNAWRAKKTGLPRMLHATEIFDAAMQGDELAAAVLHRSAKTLAYAIYNMALVINCPLFVLGGGVGMHPALVDETRRILYERGERIRPNIVSSTLGADAQLMGAVRLALDLVTVS